jgi:hypothetical protein
MRRKNLLTEPLFGKALAEDVECLQGIGPPPITFFCHSSLTL